MSVWNYSDHLEDRQIITLGLRQKLCPFCRTKIDRINLPGFGDSTENMLTSRELKVCYLCGWWGTSYHAYAAFEEEGKRQVRGGYWGGIASLRNLNLCDISTPVDEVRKYLIVKYDVRFSVNPRLFEETVGSVFDDMGYNIKVTAYSGDGGVDVILEDKNGQEVGIQVKRYKGTIQVEQIRAFTGALLLGGYTKGIFVTTSSFTKGAEKTVSLAALRGIEIELMDAPRFYDALGITQLQKKDLVNEIVAGIKEMELVLLKKHLS